MRRAIVGMIVCWIVGYLVGCIVQRTADEYIRKYQQEHPIPDEVTDLDAMERETQDEDPSAIDEGKEVSESDDIEPASPTAR